MDLMHSLKRISFKTAIVAIIIIAGLRIENIARNNQTKIWKTRSSSLEPLHNTTIVTAFFDIGPVQKSKHMIRNQTVYFKWAETFRYMRNALVVYTDSEPFRKHITAVRSDLSAITEIVMVNRSSLWSFQNLPKITKIYNSKSYPKHYPNSSPLYTCVTHAKFDLISKACQENIFKTKYYMWLDMGYFRYRKSRVMFHLTQPKRFNDSKIAINQIKDMDESISPKTIVKTSRRSFGGGLIYGEKICVMLLVEDFKRAVRYFLSKKIINAEEQILYAMFSEKGRPILNPTVELQVYRKGKKEGTWFYLGNSMITEENVTRA